MAAAVGIRARASARETPGRPRCGRPPGTGPSTATPRCGRSRARLAAMAATTATSAPGIRRLTRRSPSTRAITHAETAAVATFVPDRPVASSTTLSGSDGPGGAHPEHVAELAGRHLDAHPGEEPHQHRAGEEVGQEAEPRQPGQQQKRGDQQRGRPCQLDVARRRGDGQARQPGGQDRGGRRVGPHDKVTRGAEQREDHHRHQQRVEAGLHRHPGDPGVAEHLRDGEAGQRDTRDHVGQQLGAPQREKARRAEWPTPPTPVHPPTVDTPGRDGQSQPLRRNNRYRVRLRPSMTARQMK